jgi:fructose-1,6-bisphosphatase/inositol monophosphatase family enzyme
VINPLADLAVANDRVDPSVKFIVAALLREAGDSFILPRFENLKSADIMTKTSKTDFVTVADQDAEAWLTPHLAALWSGPVIGEEAVSSCAETISHVTDDYSWTLDPLDGTKNFVLGKPFFCSMVALLWRGRPIKSWIWQPLGKVLFYAGQGEGAWRIDDGEEIRLGLSGRPIDTDDMIGTGNTLGLDEPRKTAVQTRLRALPGRQFNGSAGIQACLIASGLSDFMIHGRATPWDHAPIDLLCREAGGYAAMLEDKSRFEVNMRTPFMAASSKVGWAALRQRLWF